MSNTGFLEVEIVDVQGRQVEDPRTEFTFFRMPDRAQLGDIRRLALPPNPRRFELPAFPQVQALQCRVEPSLYRARDASSSFFSLGAGQVVTRSITTARRPQSWQARFKPWASLSPTFDDLKTVLNASGSILLNDDTEPRPFHGAGFDDVDDEASILAKASLLNLYAKLRTMVEPIEDTAPWFSFIQRILRIGRERLIAVVEPRLAQTVLFIRQNSGTFRGEYERADSSRHFKNFPLPFRHTFAPSDMFSIKSAEELGNVQLTLAPAKDAAGNDLLLLDADIDENGDLLKHFFDLLKHAVTGGTHPYDIHELLLYSDNDLDLGYTLQPDV